MERIRKYEPLWGEWKATGKIGEGSFGAVYEVERTLWGNTSHSAVKLISFNNVEMLKGVKVDETISAEELEAVKREAARKSVNCSPSSRQLKKYKIFPASRLVAGSFLCGLPVDFMFFHGS